MFDRRHNGLPRITTVQLSGSISKFEIVFQFQVADNILFILPKQLENLCIAYAASTTKRGLQRLVTNVNRSKFHPIGSAPTYGTHHISWVSNNHQKNAQVLLCLHARYGNYICFWTFDGLFQNYYYSTIGRLRCMYGPWDGFSPISLQMDFRYFNRISTVKQPDLHWTLKFVQPIRRTIKQ